MEAEHLEILNFLRRFPPFNELPEDELVELAKNTEISYFKAGSQVLEYNESISDLYVIRNGSVETYNRNGDLFNRLSEGGFFGEAGLLRKGRVRYPVKALEDTLIYFIPGSLFNRLFDEYDSFADAVEVEGHRRINQAVKEQENRNESLSATVDTIITREPVSIDLNASNHDAAATMTDE